MKVFNNYSLYYDLLYKDKSYKKEAGYIDNLIRRFSSDTQKILDIGCGTGIHDAYLAEKGYELLGIDLSKKMLIIALNRKKTLNKQLSAKLEFSEGDVRTFNNGEKYDCILSLFHVISYQVTNNDLYSTFKTIRDHLKEGGILIFDFWYGPAVLTQKPEVRIKRLTDSNIEITRIAEPSVNFEKNYVDVNYDIFIKNKKTDSINEIKETHRMRYFFLPELEEYMNKCNLKIISTEEWLTGRKLGHDTWGVCIVAKKI